MLNSENLDSFGVSCKRPHDKKYRADVRKSQAESGGFGNKRLVVRAECKNGQKSTVCAAEIAKNSGCSFIL